MTYIWWRFSWFLCLWIKWIYLWCRFDNNSKPKASQFCQFDSNFPLRDDSIDETSFSFPISSCPTGSNPRSYTELAFFKLNQIIRFRLFEWNRHECATRGLQYSRRDRSHDWQSMIAKLMSALMWTFQVYKH